jgi:hypothetical protein
MWTMLAAGVGCVNRDPIAIQRSLSLLSGLDLFRCRQSPRANAEREQRADQNCRCFWVPGFPQIKAARG